MKYQLSYQPGQRPFPEFWLNHFMPRSLTILPETIENLWLSVFKRYRKRSVA